MAGHGAVHSTPDLVDSSKLANHPKPSTKLWVRQLPRDDRPLGLTRLAYLRRHANEEGTTANSEGVFRARVDITVGSVSSRDYFPRSIGIKIQLAHPNSLARRSMIRFLLEPQSGLCDTGSPLSACRKSCQLRYVDRRQWSGPSGWQQSLHRLYLPCAATASTVD